MRALCCAEVGGFDPFPRVTAWSPRQRPVMDLAGDPDAVQPCPLDGTVMKLDRDEIGECGCRVRWWTCPAEECGATMTAAYHRPECPTVDPGDVGTVSLRIDFDPPLELAP